MTQQPLLPLRAEPRVVTNVAFGKKKEQVSEPELFEAEIIDCVFLSGSRVKVGPDMLEFTGWHDCESDEHRIKVRFAMPRNAAIDLYKKLAEQLEE